MAQVPSDSCTKGPYASMGFVWRHVAFSEFWPTEDWKEVSFQRCLICRIFLTHCAICFFPDRDYHPNIDCEGKLFTSVLSY